MLDFFSIVEISQIRAISNAIDPSLESIWRIKCREYSQKFFTPLHVVERELDPSYVLQALYEEQYHPSIIEEELDALLEKLYILKDPNYKSISDEETEDLVDSVINKEIRRLTGKKSVIQEKVDPPKVMPKLEKLKTGSLNFSELNSIESKAENNKAGFDPQ